MAVIWFMTVALVTVAILYFYLRDFARFVYLTSKIPGPPLWELLTVHANRVIRDEIAECTTELSERYNFTPFGLWVNGRHFLFFLSDGDSVSEFFKKKDLENKAEFMYPIVSEYMGLGPITLNGPQYRQHRKLISPAFRKSALESHLPRINDEVSKMLEGMPKTENIEEIDVRSHLRDKVGAVAISIFSSGTVSGHVFKHLFGLVDEAVAIITIKSTNPFWILLKLTWLRNKIAQFWRDVDFVKDTVLKEVRLAAARLQQTGEQPGNGLEYVSYEFGQGGYTAEDVCGEATHFIGAAVETSEFVESTCLFLLALHPQVQDRVYEEQKSIFGDTDRAAEPPDLSRMTYLEMVLKESMRLFPPVPWAGRNVQEETNFNGFLLPKGCTVVMNLVALHRNPKYFENPKTFDPERFSPEQSSTRHPFAYMPFSFGPRNCPGQLYAMMVLKASLSRIVRNFKFFPTQDLKSIDDIKCKIRVIYVLRNRMLRVVRRNVLQNN